MYEKKNREIENKVDKIMDERNQIREFKKRLAMDQQFIHNDKKYK